MVTFAVASSVEAAPARGGARGSGANLVREADPLAPRPAAPRLVDSIREVFLRLRFSRRTEKAYLRWIRRFGVFHGKRHPALLGAAEVSRLLSHLATEVRVSASTQKQALCARLFLHRDVLGTEPPRLEGRPRAKAPERTPVVPSRDEVARVLARMSGVSRLIATLHYGSGLRLLECARLRVKDIAIARERITVRSGKGDEDRVTLLPASARAALRAQLARVAATHARDVALGAGRVALPDGLERKYPGAGRSLPWQCVFPATRTCFRADSGEVRRHHDHESALQRAVNDATRLAGVARHASCRTLRHSFATHLLEEGCDIGAAQELLDHRDAQAPRIHAHVLGGGVGGVRSPADRLPGEEAP